MCTRPNYMIWNGKYTFNDRPKFDFMSGYCISYDDLLKRGLPFIQVPCQQCIECRIQSKRVWADRCSIEAKKSNHNYFVTLTYDDAHMNDLSLNKRDLQLFIKRLRKKLYPHKIKFFACGEYGDKSLRKHFHVCLFDCPLDDLSYMFYQEIDGDLKAHYRPDSSGDLKYSKTIHNCWYDEDDHTKLGQISVGPFTWETAAYVAGYCMKKINPKQKDWYKETNRLPEFMTCSNGIGKDGYSEDLYDYDNLVVCGHVSSVPRYFDKLFIKKYGDNVFDKTIRSNRITKRFQRETSYLASDIVQKQQNAIREYRAKAKQKLRAAI